LALDDRAFTVGEIEAFVLERYGVDTLEVPLLVGHDRVRPRSG
jgi:hypothetical protein